MKRLPLFSITVLSGILLSLAISCKKNSSDTSFFKIQLNTESYNLDSFFAFIDSASPDFYSVLIRGVDTKTKSGVDLFGVSVPKGNIDGMYKYSVPYPPPIPYKEGNISVILRAGQYKGSYNVSTYQADAYFTIESSSNHTLKGHLFGTLDPPLNPGQGGELQYLQINGQFSVPYYWR
jgi:hypothetical protein